MIEIVVSHDFTYLQFSSVAQSCPTLCDPIDCSMLGRPPCPSPTPGVYPKSCPLGWWCHLTISTSVIPVFSHFQTFPASGSFQMSQLFTWGDQSIGVSASASFLPKNTQDWSPLEWTGWILAVQGTRKSLLQHHSSKASILRCSAFFTVQLSHPYMTTGKTIALAYEITQPIKVNCGTFCSHTCPLKWPKLCLWSVLLSESE